MATQEGLEQVEREEQVQRRREHTWLDRQLEQMRKAEEARNAEPEPEDYLMWVGYGNYPTVEDFVEEAEEMGVSKRIPRMPLGLIPGESRVFLAHDEGIEGEGVIFGYFVLGGVEVIVRDGTTRIPSGVADRIRNCEPRPVERSAAAVEGRRGCGHRDEINAIYLVSATTEEMQELVEAGDGRITGGLVEFEEPRDYAKLVDPKCTRFRAMKGADGEAIIEGPTRPLPTDVWQEKYSLDYKPGPGASWTPEEDRILMKMVEEEDSLSAAFRRFARLGHRTYRSVEYRYYGKLDGDNEGGDE